MPLTLFSRKKKEPLRRKDSLNAVVVKNQAVREEMTESNEIALTVYRDKNSLLTKLFINFLGLPEKKKIILDRRGSFIWELCNGKTTVKDMINRFAKEYTLNRKEAEVSIVHYIKSLAKKGLAGIVIQGEQDGK